MSVTKPNTPSQRVTMGTIRTGIDGLDEAVGMFCRSVAERYRPVRITLFGSCASGMARSDSDVDVLVEMDGGISGLSAAAEIVRTVRPRFAVDLLVRTPAQVQERIQLGDTFMAEVVKTGRIVYEDAHA
jgi:predicted nucleotidyltransferase